MLMIKDFFLY